ncbi:hypothetical protein HPP92_026004 [Vanilla planifolia]|uniref:Uncharacterized protein n=1 Tax=Vanilla planifolia TaxID=51239 RepID=A0A835U9V8_VANPL|nr:hypothetical protein HPP92_026004 [Vanilla planifolia]
MGMTGCGIDSREAAQRGDECRGETYVEPDDHDLDLLLGGHIANALAGVQVLFTVVDIDHSNSSACGRAKGTTKGITKPSILWLTPSHKRDIRLAADALFLHALRAQLWIQRHKQETATRN